MGTFYGSLLEGELLVVMYFSALVVYSYRKTKVFLKYYHIDALAERLEVIGQKVVHIQRGISVIV